MIFPILIFLITINSSAGETETRTVTATILYGMGEREWVKCRGTDMYDKENKTGLLVINSSHQDKPIAMDVLQKIQTFLQNGDIARSYYLKQAIRLWITMVEEAIPNQKPNNEEKVVLQILPNVQGQFVISEPGDPWKLEIPYRKHNVEVLLPEDKKELTILKEWNKVVDCTLTVVEKGPKWVALKIKKADIFNIKVNIMDLKNSPTGLYLEDRQVPAEGSANQTQIPQKRVFEAKIGYMQEMEDEYYAEITLHQENIVVKITTAENKVRLVCGFANEEKNEIMFFRGSRVLIVSPENPEKFIDVKQDFLWAFEGAKSLQVTTHTPQGILDDFADIAFAELDERRLESAKGVRILMVLPCHAHHSAANMPNIWSKFKSYLFH